MHFGVSRGRFLFFLRFWFRLRSDLLVNIGESRNIVVDKMTVNNWVLSCCKSFLSMIGVVEPDSKSVNLIAKWLLVFLGDVSVLGITGNEEVLSLNDSVVKISDGLR